VLLVICRPWEGWIGAKDSEMLFPEVSRVVRARFEGQVTDVTRQLFNEKPRATVGYVWNFGLV